MLFSLLVLCFISLPELHADVSGDTISSGNPIIKHIRSADPSAQVWEDGKVWVYASHDQDDAVDYGSMDGYHVFSSYDMINWTDHGEILHSRDVSWGISQGGFMFAPDAAYKDGIYYLYFPHMAKDWKWRVGVATSTRPEGPFTDIGRYIDNTDNIDPTCFVDDDGQAYLMWGGGDVTPKIAKLKENMTELAEAPRAIDYGFTNFGEGGYMHKRNGIYYYSYTCNTCYPIQGFYSMGDSPYGPFTYKGNLNKTPPGAQDHHSMIEYHGQWYYFYHVGNFGADGSLFRRNVCVDYLYYNEDGTMPMVVQTTTGVKQDLIGSTPGLLIPGRIEGEDFFRSEGISHLQIDDNTAVLTDVNDGDWFDFVLEILGSEVYQAEIKVSNPVIGCKIYFLVDEKVVDTINVTEYSDTLLASVYLNRGRHTLKLLFADTETAENLMDVDWIDLRGEIEYFKITSSAMEGGIINPEGISYIAQSDSAFFAVDWNVNFKPDSLIVDGISQSPASSYTFSNVTDNHSIEAKFLACNGSLLTPYTQVNNNAPINASEITATEGDDIKLSIEFTGSDDLLWKIPNGGTMVGNSISIANSQITMESLYSAILINEEGCKSEVDFRVIVEPLVLDVFEAEDWLNQFGVQTEGCSDLGGGENVGFIENNDWISYSIDVPESGIYEFVARVATPNFGGSIEISSGNKILGSVTVSGTLSNGWQDWFTTSAVEIELEKGIRDLKLTFRGSGGYLFNINWFDLIFIRASNVDVQNIVEEPVNLQYFHEANGSINIRYFLKETSDVNLDILNITGSQMCNIISTHAQYPGSYKVNWDGKNDKGDFVPSGIYVIVLTSNYDREALKLVVEN